MNTQRHKLKRKFLIPGVIASALALSGGGTLILTGALGSANAATTDANINGLQLDPTGPFGDDKGGQPFDDRNDLASADFHGKPVVRSISISTGERWDKISLTYNPAGSRKTPTVVNHGGSGGDEKSFDLSNQGRYIAGISVSNEGGNGRITAVTLLFSDGSSTTGGTRRGTDKVFIAPTGQQIVGFAGRSGANVNQIVPVLASVTCGTSGDNTIKQQTDPIPTVCAS